MKLRIPHLISLPVLLCLAPCIGMAQSDTVKADAGNLPVKTDLSRVAGLPAQLGSKVKLLAGGKPVELGEVQLSAGYYYNRDTSGLTSGIFNRSQGVLNYSIDGRLIIMQVPFTLAADANKGFYGAGTSGLNDFYKANFDVERYRQLLQTRVLSKISPDLVLNSIMSRINTIRSQYEQSLRQEIAEIGQEFTGAFNEKLDLPMEITDLSRADIGALRNRIFGRLSIDKINESRIRYQEILKNKGRAADTLAEARKVLAGIRRFEALEKVYAKVTGWKEKFENNKTVRELRSHLPFTPDRFREYLKNPGNLTDVVKKYGDLSSLQSLFMNITRLDLGQNPVRQGELNMQNIVNTGINTAFQGRKAGAGLIVGKNRNINNWMQSGLNSFVTNEYSGLTGITIGTGSGSALDQSLSVNLFNFMSTPGLPGNSELLQPNYLATARRQDAVITFHTGYRISDKHKVELDLSKSFGAYRNNMGQDSSLHTTNALSNVFGGEGKSNFAASIQYDGDILNTNLRLAVKKVGLGYNNPGNIFLRRGESQVQMAVSRRLFRQKLMLTYKGDYRNQHFDPAKNYTYLTFTNKLQMKLRLKKNSRLGLSWQHSTYRSRMLLQPDTRGGSVILQGDGSYRIRIFNQPVMNTVTLSRQQLALPLLPGDRYRSRSFLFVHSSAMPVNKNMLVLVVMANQSTNKEYYFNTSFVSTELNFNYTLPGGIHLTSGAGFYSNKGWNRQLGLKQQVSLSAMKKMSIDIGVDYKKVVTVIRKELANQLFVNAAARYSF